MATAITLPGFNDLGQSATPIFILMDHFLYQFSTFSEKMKKIYRLKVESFGKIHHQIPLILALRLCARQFQMLVAFRIINTTDPLVENMTKIVCLRWLTFDIFTCVNLSK